MSLKFFYCAILFVLFSTSFVACQIANVDCNQNNQGRHFPSGFNCSSFFTCFNHEFHLQTCPLNFWFSFQLQSCVVPEYSDCNHREPDVECNAENHGRHFPTTYNCTSYYTCFNGNFYLQNCPDLYYFVYDQQACVFLPEYDCNLQGSTTTVSTPTPPIITTSSTTPQPNPIECPSTGISKIPDLFSCTRYYLCFAGIQIRRTCSPGLYFSRSQLRCVRRDESDCDLETNICPPESDPNNIIFLPNQEDCQKYFICYDGVPEEFDCGPTLHWDPINNWCIKSEDSSCEPSFALPEIRQIECPASSLNRLEFVAHPQNCQFYFACFNNQSHLLRCSQNLLFDHIIGECFFRDQARCFSG